MNYVALTDCLGVGAGLVFKTDSCPSKGERAQMNVMLVSEWDCASISYCGLQQGAVGVWKHNTGHACGGCLSRKMPPFLGGSRSGLCADSYEGNVRA